MFFSFQFNSSSHLIMINFNVNTINVNFQSNKAFLNLRKRSIKMKGLLFIILNKSKLCVDNVGMYNYGDCRSRNGYKNEIYSNNV